MLGERPPFIFVKTWWIDAALAARRFFERPEVSVSTSGCTIEAYRLPVYPGRSRGKAALQSVQR